MKRFALTLSTVVSVLLCPLAIAQASRAPAMGQAQPQAEREMETQMMRQQAQRPTSTFDQIDTKHLGYVTTTDAKKDPWLSKNFKHCDANGDGQVTRAEFTTCAGNE